MRKVTQQRRPEPNKMATMLEVLDRKRTENRQPAERPPAAQAVQGEVRSRKGRSRAMNNYSNTR